MSFLVGATTNGLSEPVYSVAFHAVVNLYIQYSEREK